MSNSKIASASSSRAEREEYCRLLEERRRRQLFRPQPGPQTAFLETTADIALYGGAAGGGKALHIETPIPTPSGWTTMGELQSGDTVLGSDGRPYSVLIAHPIVYGRPCYRVSFSDGASMVADGEHLWPTLTDVERMQATRHSDEWRARRRATRPKRGKGLRADLAQRNVLAVGAPPPGPSPRTTEEIRATLKVRGRTNHSIEVATALDLPHVDLPIPPYVMGAWLGDGTSTAGAITGNDPEVFDAIRQDGYEVRVQPSQGNGYCVVGLVTQLRRARVFGNKHIPVTYLRASLAQRIDLLQGLLDTDGYCDARGQCEFTTTSQHLAVDVFELLVTLGMKVAISEGRATLNGKDCGAKYRLKFVTDLPAFKLPRKLARQKRAAFRPTTHRRFITSVEPVDSVPVRCIAVDSPDRCFLAGRAMVPTHNTYALLLENLRHVANPKFGSVIFRRNSNQVMTEGGLWDSARDLYPLRGAKPKLTPRPVMVFPSGAKVSFAHLQYEDDVLGWQGSQIPLICFDELTHFSRRQFFYMLSRNRSTCGVRPYMRGTTNPDADSWVASFIAWWIDDAGFPIAERSGVIRYFVVIDDIVQWGDTRDELAERYGVRPEDAKSFTFIASSVFDNRILLEKDPAYLANLRALGTVERGRLLHGNWRIRPAAGLYFRRDQATVVDVVPGAVVHVCRAWDLAATPATPENKSPDATAGVKIGRLEDGRFIVLDVKHGRWAANEVRRTVSATAAADRDSYPGTRIRVPQDPGQAGKEQAQSYVTMLVGYPVRAERVSGDKISRAEPFASQWQAGNVLVKRGTWNEAYLAELEAFPEGHDDQVDASSDAFTEVSSAGGATGSAAAPDDMSGWDNVAPDW